MAENIDDKPSYEELEEELARYKQVVESANKTIVKLLRRHPPLTLNRTDEVDTLEAQTEQQPSDPITLAQALQELSEFLDPGQLQMGNRAVQAAEAKTQDWEKAREVWEGENRRLKDKLFSVGQIVHRAALGGTLDNLMLVDNLQAILGENKN
jgi:hypothetical protein